MIYAALVDRNCINCGAFFLITPEDLEFYRKVSPKIGGKIYDIPPPTHCPDCRKRRRLAFRNERKLYNRTCDLCNKNMVSMYSPEKKRPVYCFECWHGNNWQATDHGSAFVSDRDFFGQFGSLLHQTPLPALHIINCENSDYNNYTGWSKDSYLIFLSSECENCAYARGLVKCRDTFDCYYGTNNELCYECVNCENCYRLLFSQNCSGCRDSAFLFNCSGCRDCYGCSNLNHKQYYLFNQPLSKAAYEKAMLEMRSSHHILKTQEEKFAQIVAQAIHRENHNRNSENCTGDYLNNCKNCHDCYELIGGEDLKHCESTKPCKDVHDAFGHAIDAELMYEVFATGGGQKMSFCFNCNASQDLLYCAYCDNSTDLFGCVGIRNAKYCILNKQYTKEEYETLVPKIIEHMQKAGEWGEFFPVELSPFAYNETIAQEYFSLTKEEALAKGWKWRDEKTEIPKVEKIIPAKLLPDSITDIPDDILNWAIECEETKKPFIIQKPELEFYRKMNLPIPHFHPDVRHAKRMAKRNPRKLWKRSCDNCGKDIETTYSPDRPERVFCETCYQKAVY